MADWGQVRRIALALPETGETTRHGQVAWCVRGTTFAWERPLRRGDIEALGGRAPAGPILGVYVEHLYAKEARLAATPETCFTTPHFEGYPAVLVRLDTIAVADLEELIVDAWLARAPRRSVREYLEKRRARGGGAAARAAPKSGGPSRSSRRTPGSNGPKRIGRTGRR